MKKLGLVLAASALCACCATPRPDIRATEAQRVAALLANDIAALSALTAEEFVHVNSDGVVRDRDQFISGRENGGRPFSLFENANERIFINGDTAVVIGSYRNAFVGTDPAEAKDARFVRVYVFRDRRWQNIVHQATEIAEP